MSRTVDNELAMAKDYIVRSSWLGLRQSLTIPSMRSSISVSIILTIYDSYIVKKKTFAMNISQNSIAKDYVKLCIGQRSRSC
jgi:hypothetical protein